jgi:L-lactate dehydrogenase complex protein LldG
MEERQGAEMKKEEFLKRIRKGINASFDMPEMNEPGIHYPDTYAQFVQMTEQVGGRVVEAHKTDDLNLVVRNLYPEATTFASNLPFISLAQTNPDHVAEAADLNGTDVAIVQGEFGVAENACIWIPQTMKEKAVLFIAEYLVVLLDRNSLVDNMHEAYKRIHFDDAYQYGTFMSGPSKTADIEQALVMGAQAARGLTVVMLD